MKASPQRGVKISATANAGKATKLGKAQAKFNKLVKKIEQQKESVRQWKAVMPQLLQKREAELVPLQTQLEQQQVQMVMLLDQAYPQKIFGKKDKEKLANVISELCEGLLDTRDWPEIKEIFNKYNEYDFDAQNEEMQATLKAMMEQEIGIELDEDVDLRDPMAFLRQMAEKAQQMHEKESVAQEDASAAGKKTKKQLAQQAQQEQAEKEISQSLREVYRKLASALHPDREPDEAERQRKTDLMQRANVAYDKQDLLQLLELQLEIEQIDQHAIAALSETKLKHYIAILQEQSVELEMEVEMHEFQYSMRFQQTPSPFGFNPKHLLKELDEEIQFVKGSIEDAQADLQAFTDLKAVKAWLKTVRLGNPNDFYFDGPEFLD